MKNKENIIKIVVVVIIVAGIAFYAGIKYGSSKNTQTQAGSGQFRANLNGGNRAVRQGGAFITGEIITKDAQSVTVKLREGGSNIVFLNSSTTIQKSSVGSLNDIITGTQVTITGSKNPDGSMNAQSIQIRPENNR